MKLFVLSALMMLTAVSARASEDQPFFLAMDYTVYARFAQNNRFDTAKEALKENPYEKKNVIVEPSDKDDAKWNTIKEFNSKQRNLSGGGFVNTNDRVAVGAFAGYQFEYDEINENRLNEAYSLTINVNIAL